MWGENMPRGARERGESGIYHIMIRGANKQEIFHDDEDRLRLLETLMRYKRSSQFEAYGWCLMGNHVHVLLKEGKEEISETMKRIGVSYVWYYNQKYLTTGHLFQDRFNSEVVDTEGYLKRVIRYIHQNPVKAGLVARPNDWKWSSCLGYYGYEPIPSGLLDKEYILSLYSDSVEEATQLFIHFNQVFCDDCCMDIDQVMKKRLTDEEARREILLRFKDINLAQVKALPKPKRDAVLRRVKGIKGLSQRQAARILGVSPNLIFKA